MEYAEATFMMMAPQKHSRCAFFSLFFFFRFPFKLGAYYCKVCQKESCNLVDANFIITR